MVVHAQFEIIVHHYALLFIHSLLAVLPRLCYGFSVACTAGHLKWKLIVVYFRSFWQYVRRIVRPFSVLAFASNEVKRR